MNTVFPSTAIPERIIQNHIFFKFTDLKLIIKLHIPSRNLGNENNYHGNTLTQAEKQEAPMPSFFKS